MSEQLISYAIGLKKGDFKRLSYHMRTRIERQLYFVLNEFASKKFGIGLGGFSGAHRKAFVDLVIAGNYDEGEVDVITDGFKLYDLVTALSSSDPYVVWETEDELGGKATALRTLGEKIEFFVRTVESRSNW